MDSSILFWRSPNGVHRSQFTVHRSVFAVWRFGVLELFLPVVIFSYF
jgi:hypothetical protein